MTRLLLPAHTPPAYNQHARSQIAHHFCPAALLPYPPVQVRAHITFDLLFDASIVVPGDFSLGGLLTDLLRASIADALRTLISFIDLLVIETRRLEAAGANRQLGIVHIASESVVRVRVTVTTNVEGDSVAAKTATDEMQARLADLTVADLLAAFAGTLPPIPRPAVVHNAQPHTHQQAARFYALAMRARIVTCRERRGEGAQLGLQLCHLGPWQRVVRRGR